MLLQIKSCHGVLLLTRWMFLHRTSANCFRFVSLIRVELVVVTGHRREKSRGLFTPGLSTITGSKYSVKPSIQRGKRRLPRSAKEVEPTLRGLERVAGRAVWPQVRL